MIVAIVTTFGAAVPASAQDVFNDFRRNGTINPCNYSDGQLQQGLQGLPPDIQQYAPGLADQLAAGREGCGGASGGIQPTGAVPVPSAGGGGPGAPTAPPPPQIEVPEPPAPKAKARRRLADIDTPTVTTAVATGAETPGWLLPLLAGLSLGGLLLAGIRVGGWSAERFTGPLRAAFGEAGGRTADALAQLRDAARFGR